MTGTSQPSTHGAASVLIPAHERDALERLLRYCARPAFAQVRLRQIDDARYRYDAPKPGPKGNVSLIVSPLELLDRLAALVPPPRAHRHRTFGCLAPNAPRPSPARGPPETALPGSTAQQDPEQQDPEQHQSFDPNAQPAPPFPFDQRISW